MTKEQVRESWGKPNGINKTVDISGIREQWIYKNTYFLYFKNDILKSWQESK